MQRGGSKHRRQEEQPEPARAPLNGSSHFEFTISSINEQSQEVQSKIMHDVHRRGFNSQTIFAIRLSLEEAMMNAIKHGNRLDPRKKVYIAATVNSRQAEIIVEDEGPGFHRHAVPDPTLPENIEKCSGRGIHLIEAYMDEVQWSHGGRRLRMIKRNEPDVHPR